MVGETLLSDVIDGIVRQARRASLQMACLSSVVKEKAILRMARELREHSDLILHANAEDVQAARAAGSSELASHPLLLDGERIRQMVAGLEQIAALPDPVGELMGGWVQSDGLRIQKVRVPIGVVGVLFEERPYLAVDAIALCLKSGNAVLLWSSGSTFSTSLALARIMRNAVEASGIPPHAVQFVETTDQSAAEQLMQMTNLLDAIIPTGSDSWVRYVQQHSRVPVIGTGGGSCHLYVHEDADLQMAEAILLDSKVINPGADNSIKTMLVHEKIAPRLLPFLNERLKVEGVRLRACSKTRRWLPDAELVKEGNWNHSATDLTLTIKTVPSLEEAIEHINTYGDRHSEAILTRNLEAAHRFVNEVDAACVYVNASTRFTGGYEFGFGAEIGVSTQKLHARGPIGIRELTTYKYIIYGEGQVRE